jgi:hypothetical protein
MPTILKNTQGRLAFRFGRESAMRQTCETLEQLQAQNAQRRAEPFGGCALTIGVKFAPAQF